MTNERESTSAVRDWLREGDFPLPDRVLDLALDEVATVRQRRPRWMLEWLHLPSGLGAVAAAGLLVALLSVTFLAGRFVGTPQPTPVQTPAPLSPVEALIPGGTYRIGAPFPVVATLEVPDTGWSSFGVSDEVASVYRGSNFEAGVGLWIVDNVPVDGCDLSLGELDPPVGSSVDDLAAAIATRPDVTLRPEPVTLDGHAGQYLEVTGQGVVGGGCSERVQWQVDGPAGPVRRVSSRLERDLIWILDVDGTRVVVDAYWLDDGSDEVGAAEAEVRGIVESLDIEPAP